MEVGKLTVQRRNTTGKGNARKLRSSGLIPGVFYGHELDEPISIAVATGALKGSLDPAKRRNTVIDVTIEGQDGSSKSVVAMVKDYQIDVIRRELLHVDLIAIDVEKELDAEVPIEFTGKAKGTVVGGQLHVVRRRIDVRCKPADIPTKVVLDVSDLDVNGVIHVSDIELPAGVSSTTPPRFTIITCSAPEIEETTEEGEEEAAEGAAKAETEAKKE